MKDARELCDQIQNTCPNSTITISSIITRNDDENGFKVFVVNNLLRQLCEKNSYGFLTHDNIDRFKTASQIEAEMQTDYDVDISVSTTRRRLREASMNACRPRKKPRLTSRHKKKRLGFAKAHQNWTAEQWTQVVFSDESRFILHKSDGRIFVRRMTGEELKENCVQPTVRHGGGGIMVWGCINARGCMSKVEGSLTGEVYIDVLADGLIPSRDMLGLPDG